MPKTLLLIVAGLSFFSCQETSRSSSTEDTSLLWSGSQKDKKETAGDLQHIVQRSHPFSSSGTPDFFRLILHGNSILEGKITFTITTQDGLTIYSEEFSAADLEANLVHENAASAPGVAEREAYILQRMEEFVQPADFLSPAISPTSAVETSLIKETTFKKIQANPKSIGFKYLLGKEDGRLLVYDAEKKQAVRYGSFGG